MRLLKFGGHLDSEVALDSERAREICVPNPSPPLSTKSLPSASKQNASSVSAPLPKKPKRPRPLADSALFAQREAEYEQALAEYGKAMAARKITQVSASPAPMAQMARPEAGPHGSSRGALEQGRLNRNARTKRSRRCRACCRLWPRMSARRSNARWLSPTARQHRRCCSRIPQLR